MGLLEQIQAGTVFSRQSTTLTSAPSSGSTTALGASYILLGITADIPCRVRLYSDSASIGYDVSRPSSSFDVSASVGLNLDAGLDTSPYSLIFDPPIIGTTFSASQTWYNISSSGTANITLTYYPIEFSYATRQVLTFYGAGLATGSNAYGNLASPKSFLILSASSTHSESRLRLYSRDINTIPTTEKSRKFGTASLEDASLIIDMVFDSSSYQYKLSPTLQGFNLDTYTIGSNYVGYLLDNVSTTSTLSNVTASVYIYSVED